MLHIWGATAQQHQNSWTISSSAFKLTTLYCVQLVEQASTQFVCIVDESKLVDGIGGSKGESCNTAVLFASCWYSQPPVKQQYIPDCIVVFQHCVFLQMLTDTCCADALPVEIVQFCYKYNLERLQNLPELAGSKAKLRMNGDAPYVTDNQNYIVDLYFEEPVKDPYAAAEAVGKLTGIVEHGFFLDMVDVVVIAGKDGVRLTEKKDL